MPNASNTSGVTDALPGVDVTGERCVLAVQGPNARAKVAEVDQRFADVGRFRVTRFDYDGVEVRVAGTGYTGEEGLEIAVPNEAAEGLLARLVDADIMPAGLGRARHAPSGSGPAALRTRTDAVLDDARGPAGLGPRLGQGDLPRSRGRRTRTRPRARAS